MKILKIRVKAAFLDRRAGKMRKSGDVLTITEERYREIKRSGDFVEVIPAEKVAKAAKTATAENAAKAEIE